MIWIDTVWPTSCLVDIKIRVSRMIGVMACPSFYQCEHGLSFVNRCECMWLVSFVRSEYGFPSFNRCELGLSLRCPPDLLDNFLTFLTSEFDRTFLHGCRNGNPSKAREKLTTSKKRLRGNAMISTSKNCKFDVCWKHSIMNAVCMSIRFQVEACKNGLTARANYSDKANKVQALQSPEKTLLMSILGDKLPRDLGSAVAILMHPTTPPSRRQNIGNWVGNALA